MKPVMGKDFEDYYVKQLGQGMPVFSGPRSQRGYGLGHVFRSVARSATPLLKQAGKQALKKGVSVLVKGIVGAKPKRKPTVKRSGRKPSRKRSVQSLGNKVLARGGPRFRRKPAAKNKRSTTKRQKTKPRDIFV